MDASPNYQEVAYMPQLLSFALHLVLVAWLRMAAVPRRRSNRVRHWYVEVGYGLLIAFPLLPSQL